jgi:protein-disulfide isomerase
MMLRRRAVLTLLALSAAPLFAACAGSEVQEAPADTPDQVAAEMLSSVQSPGLGLSGSVPLAGGARETTPQSQSLDVASLGYNTGPAGAPVRVLEFSDFGCGYCRRFHEESFPVLEEEYMSTGKVEWKYIPIVIGLFPNALEAARAGECAGEQDRFPEMRDVLFARQRDWRASNDPEPLLEGYARELGLEMERFNNCVSQGWRDERIQAGTQLSQEVGVRGTPTFFVVGYAPIPGAIPLELFQQVLDTVYVEATSGNVGGE